MKTTKLFLMTTCVVWLSGCASGGNEAEFSCTPGSVGCSCETNADCLGTDSHCILDRYMHYDTGFLDGYCIVRGCSQGSCPTGSTCVEFEDASTACMDSCADDGLCRPGYRCLSEGGAEICYPGCSADLDCPAGKICYEKGFCVTEACSPGSCAQGWFCAGGVCMLEVENGPGDNSDFPLDDLTSLCPDLPEWRCVGGEEFCGELIQFDPAEGDGYVDYPVNGETWEYQYRSFLRRDLVLVVQYAAAYVSCLAGDWSFGNGEPVGLVDMSEANGAIPGMSVGSLDHPYGTHMNGLDIDIAYFQVTGSDNRPRIICEHVDNGVDAERCVAPPANLDPWRTALFQGALMVHPSIRVIGVDGQIGPRLRPALFILCRDGWLGAEICAIDQVVLTYEEKDEERGFFLHHHHHLHVSYNRPLY
jgi:hypothetical protein